MTTKEVSLAERLTKSSCDKQTAPPGSSRKTYESHDFAGYGTYNVRAQPDAAEIAAIDESLRAHERKHVKLQELESTAICGNDIMSSTFYVSGIATLYAGKMAPICLFCVGIFMYLFRGIYTEAVTALPVNGGCYNILLNCTSKPVASLSAVFGIVAYIATGVVSALDAVAYLSDAVPAIRDCQQQVTIGLLFFFCVLTNLGLQESAFVAKIIFVTHIAALSLLTFLGVVFMIFNQELLLENWETPYPTVSVFGRMVPGTALTAIFYGYSSATLGCSGFETSSQFVEEQAPGVFPKTLRNMWFGIAFFNPLLSLISFAALPVDEMYVRSSTVLADTAHAVGDWIQAELGLSVPVGPMFGTLISIDAFVVLAAALLTGYVGINGYIRRMSMDRCLPQFFMTPNPWTGTDSIILIGYFLLCTSQVIILKGNVAALGGVYCYAFLSVMIIFALGNMMLKIKRPGLPRDAIVPWIQPILGFLAVALAMLGNIMGKPELLAYFMVYFLIFGAMVLIMFQRVRIMRLLYKMIKRRRLAAQFQKSSDFNDFEIDISPAMRVTKSPFARLFRKKSSLSIDEFSPLTNATVVDDDLLEDPDNIETPPPAPKRKRTCLDSLSSAVQNFQDVPFVFFIKHDDAPLMNKAIQYIRENEQTNQIIFVHCDPDSEASGSDDMISQHVKQLDLLYPRVKISLLIIKADFNPVTAEWLSKELHVPTNAMFISCPDETFSMHITQLRGMRIIASND